ncbi:MAG TPA: glycosyltransferase family 2 protein [Coleofasciculaceae cyanobacterium]|jgi:hypothetical protein
MFNTNQLWVDLIGEKFKSSMSFFSIMYGELKRKSFFEFGIQSIVLHFNIQHLHGLKKISYASNEVIVICLVRNGALYIESFLNHYTRLGIKHFIFLDNVPADQTVEMLASYKNVTIPQSDLRHKVYESIMRRYLATRFSKDQWNLCSEY